MKHNNHETKYAKKISEYESINWEEVEREIIQSYENEWQEIEMIGSKIKN